MRFFSFRSFVFVLPCFPSLMLGVLVLYSNPNWYTLWPLSDGVLVVIVTVRTSSSHNDVVYDVHDCFVDRHNKKNSSF